MRSSRNKKIDGMYLFNTRKGQPYIAEGGKSNGFELIWQRSMKNVVDSGIERFTEHDLRAKAASGVSLEKVKELLGAQQTLKQLNVFIVENPTYLTSK